MLYVIEEIEQICTKNFIVNETQENRKVRSNIVLMEDSKEDNKKDTKAYN